MAWHQNREPSLRTCQRMLSAWPSVPGRLEFVLGLAAEDVLGGEEAGEVLADDLVRPVAEEPLGPEVPADQLPVRVDQEEGVLRRVGRQQVEPLGQDLGRSVGRVVRVHVPSSVRIGGPAPAGGEGLP